MQLTEEEQEVLEVMKALTNKKLRNDFLFYRRTLVKADQVKREEYGLLPESCPAHGKPPHNAA